MMQIREIVIYSYHKQKRVISLKTGTTNIITGTSSTGKSAIALIVDYCLCQSSCMIPDSVVTDKVAWFGLLLQFPDSQMFVARENPSKGRNTTNKAYWEQGDVVFSPDIISESNTTTDALRDLLTNKIGISPNSQASPSNQNRSSIKANIRHAMYYCYQNKTELGANNVLFHRQSDPPILQAIKDTLPYFLGAIREDQLASEQQLAGKRKEYRRKLRALQDAESIRGIDQGKALALLAEAVEVDLISVDDVPSEQEAILAFLQQITTWIPNEQTTFLNSDTLGELQEDVVALRRQLSEKYEEIREAKKFAHEAEGFTTEVHQQQLRLEAIQLFKGRDQNAEICPICSQALEIPVPGAIAINRTLDHLKSNLKSTARERPRLRDHINKLESEHSDIKQRIREKNQAIDSLLREDEAASQFRDINIRRGRVVGRISLWLESTNLTDGTSQLREDINKLQREIRALEQEFDPDEKTDRINSILNRINVSMSELIKRLDTEYKDAPVHFDLKNLTVVVDTETKSIPLVRMGSSQNWLAYHIVTLLSFHKHFVQQNRPVPRFLFIDQPSQVYYPEDIKLDPNMNDSNDEDRQAILRIFNLIFDEVDSLSPNFQVIIIEHANLDDKRYQSHVRENWRGGNALVPYDWVSRWLN